MTTRFSQVTASAALLALLAVTAPAQADTQTKLPAAPGFSWGDFGIGGGYVPGYLKNDGTAGGKVTSFTTDVYDIDPDPNEKDPLVKGKEKIGSLDFQFVLYQEESKGKGTGVNGLGAALIGGFHLTDTDDVGTDFSFLQTVTQTDNATGKQDYQRVDGGGSRGKVNGDIPGYAAKPDKGDNWNYAGTEYDYLDNPVRPSTSNQTVSFETALVCYHGKDVILLSDFTWSFSTDGKGKITGVGPTEQATASASLLDPYKAKFKDIKYNNVGDASCHAAHMATPEVSPNVLLLCGGLMLGGLIARARRRMAV